MQWRGRRQSSNIEDRRGMRGAAAPIGGIGLLAVLAIGYFLGIDVSPILDEMQQGQPQQGSTPAELSEADRQAGEFVAVTLADTEEVWQGIFRQMGRDYQPAVMVLYSGVTQSPCGGASGATGPFYCPNDRKVYLDTAFFSTLARRLGAHGDFAAAYVVAHEVAHHVQDELGILERTNELRARASEADANAISVRVELQADCLSGIWARHAEERFGAIEQGDLEEAVNAARQIGDDTLQSNAGRVPQPHTFTHGTSEQRSRWFARGYQSGDPNACDTFSANRL